MLNYTYQFEFKPPHQKASSNVLAEANMRLLDAEGTPLVELRGLRIFDSKRGQGVWASENAKKIEGQQGRFYKYYVFFPANGKEDRVAFGYRDQMMAALNQQFQAWRQQAPAQGGGYGGAPGGYAQPQPAYQPAPQAYPQPAAPPPQPPQAPLPPGWTIRHDPTQNNKPFYYNEQTGEARWDPPPAPQPAPQAAPAPQMAPAAPPPQPTSDPLAFMQPRAPGQ